METEKKEEHKEHKLHHHLKPVSKKFSPYYLFVGLTILLGIILVINIILTSKINADLKKGIVQASEKSKPAKIELTILKNSKCTECFDTSTIVSQIRNTNSNITKEKTIEFDTKEGKEIIGKYEIERIPTVILTGEIDKVNIQYLEKKNNALLLADVEPPYTNAANGKIEGRVTLYVLRDKQCTKCNDLNALISQIKGAGIKISEEKDFDAESIEAKELIAKYNINFISSLILSRDASAYSIMQQAWSQVGTKENDGSYVLRLVYPPFVNLTTNKIMGLVDIVYLIDKTCNDCYDVKIHREILASPQSFAINLEKEETIDVDTTRGKELIAKYNITQVPATILSSEVDVYPSNKALRQFFSVEKDGYYVFRSPQVLGTYKDLQTNQVVKAQQSEE